MIFQDKNSCSALNPYSLIFWLKIQVNGEDITHQFDTVELVKEALPVSGGYNQGPTASSGVKTALGILTDSGLYTHSPGPNGISGGYPVRLNSDVVEVVRPHELTQNEAEKINNRGMKADGIERVDNQGTVYFTTNTRELLEEFLGISRKYVKLDELMDMTKELRIGYMRLEEKYKDDNIHL